MADGHGGQRTPANPAAVSGPGALSQRTDGGPTNPGEMVASDGSYGDRKDMQSIQSGATMMPPGPTRAMLPGLTDPSARPGEPVTAGADLGPGPSAAAAGIKSDRQLSDERLRPLMHSLEILANMQGSNPETRTLVRNLKARLSNG